MDDPAAILEDSSRSYTEIAVEGAIRFRSTITGVTICILAPLAGIGAQTVGWPDAVVMVLSAGPIIVVLLYWVMAALESTRKAYE